METKPSFEKIQKKIKEFDVCALVKAIQNLSYPFDSIFFVGHSNYASCVSLCQSILFAQPLYPHLVIISLNLGLFVPNSPIPSYFRKWMEEEVIDEEKLTYYLQFFDHILIKNFIKTSIPENFLFLGMKHYHIKMLGVNSIYVLHLLIQLCFPELCLSIKKKEKILTIFLTPFRLGLDKLTSPCPLGGEVRKSVFTFEILFTTEYPQTELGIFWPLEILKRLKELIFPLLIKMDMHFSIFMNIHNCNIPTFLSQTTHLGYTRLGECQGDYTFCIFEGYIF